MTTQLPKHRLFDDFKHINVDVDLTLCWPPGAGGHFLCNAITSTNHAPNSLNEYGHIESLWNYLDFENLYDIPADGMNEYLNNVYNIAVNFDGSKNSNILRTHRYPLLLSKVFNFRSEDIVIIYPDEESKYLLSMLSVIKHRFNPVWDFGSITELVSNVTEANIKVRYEDIQILTDQLDTYCNVNIFNKPIVWDYFLHCKKNNITSTKATFNDFIKGLFNNKYFSNDVSAEHMSELIEYLSAFGKCTIINYTDLFFKLKIPSDGYLSKLEKEKIYRYSLSNLSLVDCFSSLADDDEIVKIKNYIGTLSQYLKENKI